MGVPARRVVGGLGGDGVGVDGARGALVGVDAGDGRGGSAVEAVAGGLGHVGVLSGRCCRVPWPGRLTYEAMLLLHKLQSTLSIDEIPCRSWNYLFSLLR